MLLVNDSTIASSSSSCQPCQVQGFVSVTRRRVGTFLRLRRWKVLRSCRPSFSVSKSRPLVWPSLWQVLQLYHWLNDRAASWNTTSPRRASDGSWGRPARSSGQASRPRRPRPGPRRRGSWRRRASCRRGRRPARSAGRPARRGGTRPSRPEQLGGHQVARALVAPGEPLAIGAQDHQLVGAAQADHEQGRRPGLTAIAVGVGGGLALRVERERGELRR